MKQLHWILLAVAGLIAGSALADDWATPIPRIFASPNGRHGLKVMPSEENAFRSPSTAVLFSVGKDGTDKVLWRRALVNSPHQILVHESGRYVATIDTWARLGYEHSVVVYGQDGKVIVDLPLEALFNAEEIQKNVKRSVSSRWWAEKATVGFETSANGPDTFIIKTDWGRTVRINLRTGEVSRSFTE